MATKNIRICDVYGTTKDIKAYKLTLEDVAGEPSLIEEDSSPVRMIEVELDLSPRAVKRLRKFVRRGIDKPVSTSTKKG